LDLGTWRSSPFGAFARRGGAGTRTRRVITHHWGRFNWFNCQNQKPCPRIITLPHDKKKEAKSLLEETKENKMANKKKRKRKRRKEKKKLTR
jgi:hypothetical protein